MEHRPDVQQKARWPLVLAHMRAAVFAMLAIRAQGVTGVPVRYSNRSR